jgi:beta-galactosidase GanA
MLPSMPLPRLLTAALTILLTLSAASLQAAEIPHLRTSGSARQLIVDGRPFLILGGELANSSASSLDYMQPIWPRLRQHNLNTVLAPVSWELIEPSEGRFDFTLVDGMLAAARRNDLRLVLLWFGSWKNSMSTYVPAWVKRDSTRFPRARGSDGGALDILSPFAEANAAADARAFAALMRHLRETDPQGTVIMVQVENEVGMIPEARDHSPAANRAFAGPVPAALLAGRKPGTWTEHFGTAAEESFMAWHFASYVERVASAGKAQYPLPLFVNAALPRPGKKPGEYPSAGPLPRLSWIWRAAAPSIDFLAPDIYYPNFVEWARNYARADNPLFIPEANQAGRGEAAADAFFAIAELDAIGFSPFSIDSEGPGLARLESAYAMLRGLAAVILAHQGKRSMHGFRPPAQFDGTLDDRNVRQRFGGYMFDVGFIDPWTPRPDQRIAEHGGLIIQLGPDEFLFAGSGITTSFASAMGQEKVGIESIWEGAYVDGAWKPGRLLNGDQSHQGRHVRLPPDAFSVQRVKLYRYR